MSRDLTDLRPGDVLAGKYRVERVLGAGGMGVVVAAYHLGLDKKVAVKLLLPDMLQHEDIVARFAREARAAAKITNEHVTHVFDVGVLDDGAPFMVMELLDGLDLHQWLAQRGPLGTELAVDFLLQACEAIGEAHDLGIVHRDLKPANLFCVRRTDGTMHIKVLDFGISKVAFGGASAAHLSMTKTAAVLGTPFYMSPEQMESARDVDGRSDIWALGVILYELLTGKVPFGGDTLPEVCFKIAMHDPPPIKKVLPGVPAEVEAAISKCLQKDRTKRFSLVADLASALAPYGTSQAIVSARRLGQSTRAALGAGHTSGTFGAFEPADRSRSGFDESLSAVGHTQASFLKRKKALTGLVLAGGLSVAAVIAVIVAVGSGRGTSAPASALISASGRSTVEPDAGSLSALEPPTSAEVLAPAEVPSAPAAGWTPPPDPEPEPVRRPVTPRVWGRPHGAAPNDGAKPLPGSPPGSRRVPEPDTSSNAFDERL